MGTEEKTVWIDEENKIVSFHAIENSEIVIIQRTCFGISYLG